MSTRPIKQKTIGVLGGMSDRATVEYYNFINRAVNKRLGGWDIAETLIVGCNFGNIEHFVRQNDWETAEKYLLEKARLAESGGADILICMSNTMHKVLARIDDVISIPFIHIATPTAVAVNKLKLNKVALLGTLPVMAESYMREQYEQAGIEIVVPSPAQQTQVDQIIFNELVKNIVTPASKQTYIDICNDLVEKGAQGVILGCTEIFLLIQPEDFEELPLFNTTELHVNAVVAAALAE
ncbi:MAG: aspartate/glutamate racemase family protein [Gammaproteobacteria bacterium]